MLPLGEIKRIELRGGGEMTLSPGRGFDLGAGQGQSLSAPVTGGEVGLILDGRGRPIAFPDNTSARQESARSWATSLDLY